LLRLEFHAELRHLDHRDVALWLLGKHPALDRAYDVSIYFCFLDDLRDRGPFAPIFYAVGKPQEAVNWIGEGKESER
jgi:hypothetical protein